MVSKTINYIIFFFFLFTFVALAMISNQICSLVSFVLLVICKLVLTVLGYLIHQTSPIPKEEGRFGEWDIFVWNEHTSLCGMNTGLDCSWISLWGMNTHLWISLCGMTVLGYLCVE